MDFIQIVEFQTDNIEEVVKAASSVPVPEGAAAPQFVTVVRDRDRPGTYATILRFDSYEAAMEHSEHDATHERIAKIGPLMKGEPRFYNLDVIDDARM